MTLNPLRGLNVVRFAKGGGPNELPQNKSGFALAPGGNLFVADPSKVLELDPRRTWWQSTPTVPWSFTRKPFRTTVVALTWVPTPAA